MKKVTIFATVFLCVFCLCLVYSVSVQSNLCQNLVRLHVIANSDSVKDQGIKLGVRDKILENSNNFITEDYGKVVQEYLEEIGAPYSARVTYEKCYVPAKSYKEIVLPQGEYNCIKVTLGEGAGRNWWCVAYPPLCYTESMFGGLSEEGRAELEYLLDEETMRSIVKNGKINIRFKIVDSIQRLFCSKTIN